MRHAKPFYCSNIISISFLPTHWIHLPWLYTEYYNFVMVELIVCYPETDYQMDAMSQYLYVIGLLTANQEVSPD